MSTTDPRSETAQSELEAGLAAVWTAHLPETRAQARRIDDVATEPGVEAAARADAREAAHRVRGLCDIFGRREISELAGRAEHLLEDPSPDDRARRELEQVTSELLRLIDEE